MLEQLDEYEEIEQLAKTMRTKNSLNKPAEALPKRTIESFQQLEAAIEEQPLALPAITVKRVEDLPTEVNFFLTEIYPTFDDKLILFGVLQNGERIAIQIQEMDRNIYFVLKGDNITEAKQEIDRRLRAAGISKFEGEFVNRRYVFEIEGIPRKELTFYKVAYPFSLKTKEAPKPDW